MDMLYTTRGYWPIINEEAEKVYKTNFSKRFKALRSKNGINRPSWTSFAIAHTANRVDIQNSYIQCAYLHDVDPIGWFSFHLENLRQKIYVNS